MLTSFRLFLSFVLIHFCLVTFLSSHFQVCDKRHLYLWSRAGRRLLMPLVLRASPVCLLMQDQYLLVCRPIILLRCSISSVFVCVLMYRPIFVYALGRSCVRMLICASTTCSHCLWNWNALLQSSSRFVSFRFLKSLCSNTIPTC
jgi:hypothetical protein